MLCALIKDAVKMSKYSLSQTESPLIYKVSGIYIRQYVNSSDENGESWYMTNNNQLTVYISFASG